MNYRIPEEIRAMLADSPDIGGHMKEVTRENLVEAMEFNLNSYWKKKLDGKL